MPRMSKRDISRAVEDRNLKTLLETSKPFRKFLWTLLVDAGIFYTTFTRGSPHDTSYMEGRRSLGLEVLHRLKYVRPDILSILEAEGNMLEADLQAAPPDNPDEIEDPDEP